ncbi:MAG: hypothetical protein JW809_08235 [Pirellulales bacterium]|nr:hypothetical protein [Pirellulales bacterium]
MYRHLLTIAAIAALVAVQLLSATAPATAELIAADDFESYSLGSILDQGTVGGGWASAWSGRGSTKSGYVPLRDVSAGVMAGFGQSLEVGFSSITTSGAPTNHNIVQRTFDAQTGDVYVGFAVKTTGMDTAGVGDFVQLFFNNTVDTSNTSSSKDSSLSGAIDFGPAPDGSEGAYIVRKGGDYQTPTSFLHPNDEIHRVVIRFSKSGGNGGNYDEVALFVDQATEGTPDAMRGETDEVNLAAGSLTTLSQLHLRLYGLEATDRVYVDDLRIATTYAEAIPEPSGLALALVGGGLLLAVIHRRRLRVR